MEPPAKTTRAAAFALKIVAASIGNGPRIAASRTSSARASHSPSVTSAITAIDQPTYRHLSSSERSETWPGVGSAAKYLTASSIVTTRPKEMMQALTTANVWWRSASGEIRSFSMNRLKNSRARSRVVSGTQRGHVRDFARRALRVRSQHQFREHLLQRASLPQIAQVLHRIVRNHTSAMENDHLRAHLFDNLHDVRA